MNVPASEFLIYGVAISLTSSNPQFKDFVEGTLHNYVNRDQEQSNFNIHIAIQFDEKADIKKSKFRIWNGIYFDNEHQKIAFNHKLFTGEFSKRGNDALDIKGEVLNPFPNTIKQTAKGMFIKNYSYSEMLFHQLYRELILMPVFWILRNKFGKYLMHASAISIGNESLVFLGNDGVGKTTIALQLLQQKDTLFFGDNFLLYDAERIYSFVDTLRVNKKDCDSFLDENKKSKYKKVFEGKSRVHFNYHKDYIAENSIPTSFYVLMQGEENEKRRISEDEFINFTFGINNFVKEFDKFSYAATLIYLFVASKNIVEEELNALKRLVQKDACFLLQVNKNFKEYADLLIK